jgi:DNA-directed RNA polymerase subunit M/transcription elongation factor TFIIS
MNSRNDTIVQLLNSGRYTLQEIGNKYNITRERVRKIYANETGQPYQLHRKFESRLKQAKIKKKELSVKFICAGCHKPATYSEVSRKKKLCSNCHDLLINQHRNPYIVLQCVVCGATFHPFRDLQYQHKTKNFLCSNRCRMKYLWKINELHLNKKRKSVVEIEAKR